MKLLASIARISISAALLVGCASVPDDDAAWDAMFQWRLDGRVYEDSQITVIYVPHHGAILALCGPRLERIGGCARRLPEACNIVLLESLRGQPYPLAHETRHCKGWSHN